MKKIIKILLVILSICSLSSCNGQSNEKKISQDNMENLTLIVSVSGGTRAHIININSEYELSYRVGSFTVDDSLDLSKIKWNNSYKEINKALSNKESEKIKAYYLDRNNLLFKDTKIVKDNWEYYLFINGTKIAFGNKFNYDNFPISLKELISYILNITGNLYDIPGMS